MTKAKSVSISVIDDDQLVREAMEQLLRSLGYDVHVFASAEEYLAYEWIICDSCLIADINLPGMSGIDLQKRLIANGYGVPVIIMSGCLARRVRTTVMEAGAIGFLSKPIDPERLVELLKKAPARR